MRKCNLRQLGRVAYGRALEIQRQAAAGRKAGLIPDQLLLLEHPHVITLGRNGRMENLLASDEILSRAGIGFYPTDRGGDVTYHGPGQLVGYPIFDLREWRRDVGAYVRAVEQAIIDTLAEYGIAAGRIPKLTGVWVGERKIAAIGVHLSRWVTSHGFALTEVLAEEGKTVGINTIVARIDEAGGAAAAKAAPTPAPPEQQSPAAAAKPAPAPAPAEQPPPAAAAKPAPTPVPAPPASEAP